MLGYILFSGLVAVCMGQSSIGGDPLDTVVVQGTWPDFNETAGEEGICYLNATVVFTDGRQYLDSIVWRDDTDYYDIHTFCEDSGSGSLTVVNCSSDEYLWPGDTEINCLLLTCPRCECSNQNLDPMWIYQVDQDTEDKTCYQCTCENGFSSDNLTDTAWQCTEEWGYEVGDNNYKLYNESDCVYCWYKDVQYSVGADWWDSASDNSTINDDCDMLCLCQSDGEAYCVSGMANIIADEILYDYFMDDCATSYNVYGCLDSPADYHLDSWTSNSISQCGCPYCNCTDAVEDDHFSFNYTDPDNDVDYYYCAWDCNCFTTTFNGELIDYVSCSEKYVNDLTYGTPRCPPLYCMDWEYNSSYHLIKSPDNDDCDDSNSNYFQDFCMYAEFPEWVVWDESPVYADYITGNCDSGFLCDIAGYERDATENTCKTATIEYTSYALDCMSEEAYEVEISTSSSIECCDTDYCTNNTAGVSEETCTANTDLGTFLETYYGCLTSETVATSYQGYNDYCNQEIPDYDWTDHYSYCENLAQGIDFSYGCLCNAYGSVWSTMTGENQNTIENVFYPDLVNSGDCNANFSCTWDSGSYSLTYEIYEFEFYLNDVNLLLINADGTYIEDDFKEYIAAKIPYESSGGSGQDIGRGDVSINSVSTNGTYITTSTVTIETYDDGVADDIYEFILDDTYGFVSEDGCEVIDISNTFGYEVLQIDFVNGAQNAFAIRIAGFIGIMVGIYALWN